MKKITTALNLQSPPDLGLLGVPDSVHNRAPGPELFPPNFNPQLRKQWDRLFKDEVVLMQLRAAKTNDDKWRHCVKAFLTAARSTAANPFQPHYSDSENGKITATLKAHRANIHKEMEKHGLTDVVYTSAKPEVVRRKSGFGICVSCRMKTKDHRFADATVLAAHLTRQGFVQTKSGVFEKVLNPEASIKVDTRKKPILSYSIATSRHPFIQSWNVVTKAKYAQFVTSKIWKPLTKAHPCTFSKYGV